MVKKISFENGLSQLGFYSICQGPRGKFWIGLDSRGLNFFDS